MNEGRGSQIVDEALVHLQRGLDLLSGHDFSAVSGAELGVDIRRLSHFTDLLALQNTRLLALFDAQGGFLASGASSSVAWLRSETHQSAGQAARQVSLARGLEDLSATLFALESGAIGIGQAQVIARGTQDPAAPVEAEAELLAAAVSGSDPVQLQRVGRDLIHRASASSLDELAARQQVKRRLRWYETGDGMVALEGLLPPLQAERFLLCMQSVGGVPAKGDARTSEQRNLDVFGEVCARLLASGKLPRLGGRVPQITIVVTAEALSGQAGAPAPRLEGVGPVAISTVRELLARDCSVRIKEVDSRGVTLNFGRAQRIFSSAQREEVVSRHPHCVWPGCDRLARQGEMDHLDPWFEGGSTDCRRAVPLCRFHHRLKTKFGWRLCEDPELGFVAIPPESWAFNCSSPAVAA